MTINEKVSEVKNLYNRLDKEVQELTQETGLHCLPGCGACCIKPYIEATILEFIPLALHFYETGKLEEQLEFIEQNSDKPTCVNFIAHDISSGKGYCGQYENRGLICRLFGYSAVRNKFGENILVTCKRIKESQAAVVQQLNEDLKAGKKVPRIGRFYDELKGIDYNLSDKMYPINQAIKKALEYVAFYFYYQNQVESEL
jgi:Fe-S-cluster containining protein